MFALRVWRIANGDELTLKFLHSLKAIRACQEKNGYHCCLQRNREGNIIINYSPHLYFVEKRENGKKQKERSGMPSFCCKKHIA
jgi:hypothetical protein